MYSASKDEARRRHYVFLASRICMYHISRPTESEWKGKKWTRIYFALSPRGAVWALLLSSPPSSICQLTFYLRSDSPSPYAYGKCVLRFETKFNPDWNPPNPISLHPSHSVLRRFQRARFIKYFLSPSFLFEHLRKWTTLRNVSFSFLFYLSILIKPNPFLL